MAVIILRYLEAENGKVEKAIHITNIANLRYLQTKKYQRVYWGVEFCQNLIPSLEDTQKALELTRRAGMGFTLVCPFVTESGIKRLDRILAWLKRERVCCEVVVNDWGVLELLNTDYKKRFEIALGRLLVRQQRDPAMKRVLEKQPPIGVKGKDGKIHIVVHRVPAEKYQIGVKSSYINSRANQRILSEFGIERVELNNLVQGVDLNGLKWKKSLYTPYVHISTTRFCPMDSKEQRTYRINVCKKECQKYYDILRNRALPKIIYKRGNTTFYKNSVNNRMALKAGIDRIVFQPEIPF
ncbi:MAG: hypothetical protein JW847_02480 [Candidatus Omnitrophica bacterium]|nr:hypothetical protein [Candidatus Omnitrophota bacterium]